jgi:hypothetical protein
MAEDNILKFHLNIPPQHLDPNVVRFLTYLYMCVFSLPYHIKYIVFIKIKQITSQKLSACIWGLCNLLFHGYWGSFPGVKRPGHNLNYSPTLSAETMRGAILLLRLFVFMACTGIFFNTKHLHHQIIFFPGRKSP